MLKTVYSGQRECERDERAKESPIHGKSRLSKGTSLMQRVLLHWIMATGPENRSQSGLRFSGHSPQLAWR